MLATLLIGASAPADPNAVNGSHTLDLKRYEMNFDEPFDRLDVSPWGPGTRWIAHTPWAGDFGDARFIDPTGDSPFRIVNGILQIEMRRRDGRWQSGLLAASDRLSRGFLQSGGYFEMRAKLPGGRGVWPAFWLGSNPAQGQPGAEIDILEYYGHAPDSYRGTVHIWKDGNSIFGNSHLIPVPPSSLESDFHTYGVEINKDQVVFYLDRREVAREPGKPEYLQRLYPMVDLAAGGGWPIEGMPDPSIMYVDYVRAYKLKR